ncbi:MAG: EamA family transporter [Anaerolineaceae bacterium]|nr:EamA family transporter [Anaerolineaceae bacterium]
MKANALLILSTILWGIWGIADKYAVSRAHPYTIQWMFSIPFMVFIPLWYFLSKRAETGNSFDIQAFGWATLASVASILAVLLFLFALQSKPASIAVAITSAYPLVTLALALILKTEQLTLPKVIGVLLILAGIGVLQIYGS